MPGFVVARRFVSNRSRVRDAVWKTSVDARRGSVGCCRSTPASWCYLTFESRRALCRSRSPQAGIARRRGEPNGWGESSRCVLLLRGDGEHLVPVENDDGFVPRVSETLPEKVARACGNRISGPHAPPQPGSSRERLVRRPERRGLRRVQPVERTRSCRRNLRLEVGGTLTGSGPGRTPSVRGAVEDSRGGGGRSFAPARPGRLSRRRRSPYAQGLRRRKAVFFSFR